MTTPQDPYGPPPGSGAGSSPQPPPQWGAPQAPPGQQPFGQPPGQQPYGQQPWGTGGPPKRNGLGVAALVLGLLALVTCFTIVGGIVLGVVAIGLGIAGRGRAKRGEADNGGLALAGIVLGVVGIALSGLFIAVGVALFNSDDGRDLIDCLNDAGDDQAAIEQCRRDFEDSVTP